MGLTKHTINHKIQAVCSLVIAQHSRNYLSKLGRKKASLQELYCFHYSLVKYVPIVDEYHKPAASRILRLQY